MNHDDFDYLPDDCPQPGQWGQPSPADWRLMLRMLPWFISATAWLVWCAFLVLPTFYGLHGVDRYPVENNIVFMLTGLVLVLASTSALDEHHLIRSATFASVVFTLAYWF